MVAKSCEFVYTWWCSVDSYICLWMSGKTHHMQGDCVAPLFLTVSKSSWMHVHLDENSIIFCLFTLRRSRTETASSHVAWLQSVHASMCPCVTERGMSAALLVRNVETTWSIFIVVTHSSAPSCAIFLLLTLIHSRREDWLTAVWVQRDIVFITMVFCACQWSVSHWLRANTQLSITSLNFCLSRHRAYVWL